MATQVVFASRDTIAVYGRTAPASSYTFLVDGGGLSIYGQLDTWSIEGVLVAGAPDVNDPARIGIFDQTMTVYATLSVVGALTLQASSSSNRLLPSEMDVFAPVWVEAGATLSVVGNVKLTEPLDVSGGTIDLTKVANRSGLSVRFDDAAGRAVLPPLSTMTAVDFRAGDTITVAGADLGLPFYNLFGSTWWLGTTVAITFAGSTAPGATYAATPDGTGNIVISTTSQPAATVAFSDAVARSAGTHGLDPVGTGGPDYLQWSFIEPRADAVALSTAVPDVIIGGGAGNQGLQVASGQNVLDGGRGSAFMTGGTGSDTFFADLRGAEPIWDTLVNFHQGDALTVWGWTAADTMTIDPVAGAGGATGATLRLLDGGGTVKASVTFAGMTADQVASLQTSTGRQQAGDYLYFYNAGV